MLKFVIRADSSTQLGTGHVVRCLNLAIELRERGADVSFICRPLPGNVAAQATARGFTVHLLPASVVDWQTDAEATAALIETQGPADWLVVDHYGLDQSWERALAKLTRAIMVIDDLADRRHECTVLLDQNFYEDFGSRYAKLVPGGCRQLLGPRYALLSSAFRDLERPHPRSGRLNRLFVFFGGTDSDNETSKALAAIRKLNRADLAVDIVMGAANPHQQAVRELARQLPRATCHVQIETMHELMLAADLAIGAGGTATWERLRTGLPCITIAIADNQVQTARDLGAAGYIELLGERRHVSVDQIASAIEKFATQPLRLRQMSGLALSLVDGQGTRRVANVLMPIHVVLNTAAPDDCERIFEWRNAETNRKWFFDDHILSLAEHRAWYANVLADPARELLIGSVEGSPIGVLRFERSDAAATVSIYLVPGLAGRGLGTALLNAGRDWIRKTHPDVASLHAEIKPDNSASRGAFVAAGYADNSRVFHLRLEGLK